MVSKRGRLLLRKQITLYPLPDRLEPLDKIIKFGVGVVAER